MAAQGASEQTLADPNRPTTWSRPPSWLLLPAVGDDVLTPPEPLSQLLPLDQLGWEDFERLCLRLVEGDSEIVHTDVLAGVQTTEPVARMYGHRGQAQFGIDLYARDPIILGGETRERPYVCLQARRVQRVTKTGLRGSASDFLKGKWSGVARKFIFATSCSALSTALTEEIEALSMKLARASIEFDVWDQERISGRLRENPRLVHDFFGRAWVTRFCGDTAAEGLRATLDAHEVTTLRRQLAGVYGAAFRVADSGLLALHGQSAQAIGLHDRFVTPDLVSTTSQGASVPVQLNSEEESWLDARDTEGYPIGEVEFSVLDEDANPLRRVATRTRRSRPHQSQSDERRSARDWLGATSLQVVVGEPGAGKSALLRFLILDLLSEEPKWRDVCERWGRRLPVWLPFHFLTQRVADNTGASASIGAAIHAWLEQYDIGHVWPLVEAALGDDRLLLIVDGLDEWISDETGRYAASAVETFAESHSAAVVVSTRPYGLTRLTLGAGWVYARIAALTPVQQRELTQCYFETSMSDQDGPSSADVVRRAVDGFMAEVQQAPDLRTVAGVPLFLVLLIGLRLSNAGKLPDRRFEVYDQAVRLLLAEHPANRRAAAAVTARRHRLSDRQTRALLTEVAFVGQCRGDVAVTSEVALRKDLIRALTNPERLGLDRAAAATTADSILDVVEGELGLLVRTGPTELGFLHRMLQEQLAAEYIVESMTPVETKKLFGQRVGDPTWREVLLVAMWRTSRPTELRDLALVIQSCISETPAGLRAREMLAEVVFGSYGLPGGFVHEFLLDLARVVESHPYSAHRARLLDSVFSGLEGVTTREAAEKCLRRWTLLLRRPSADLVWDLAHVSSDNRLSGRVVQLLLLAVGQSDSETAYAAGVSIATRCSESGLASDSEREALKAGLLGVLSDPASGSAAAAALVALSLGWRGEQAVEEILAEARGHSNPSVRIVALSDALRVLRPTLLSEPAVVAESETPLIDQDERQWLASLMSEDSTSDAHAALVTAAVSEAVRSWSSAREFCVVEMRNRKGWDGDLVWSVALRAFGDDARVVENVCDELRSQKYLWTGLGTRFGHEDRLKRAYPPGSLGNAAVSSAIEDHLNSFGAPTMDYELLQLAAIDHGPVMRQTLLDSLGTSPFPFWAAQALADQFLDDSEVRATLRDELLGDPVRASRVANIANTVLDADEVLPRLMEILRALANGPTAGNGRLDIVASAIAEAWRVVGATSGMDGESIADESIGLMPLEADPITGDPTYTLALAFHPARAASSALARLAEVEGHPAGPFLRAFRDDPVRVEPFLEEAESVLRSLPAYLRSRLCQLLVERPVAPDIVVPLVERWPDEASERNKSPASLAYHRAIVEAREDGLVSDDAWETVRGRLADQASCYGFDHEARRRAAWVGMCVLGDWSMLDGRQERIGESIPVGVNLTSPIGGPDMVLLESIARQWQELKDHFGDDLISRLSGSARGSDMEAWSALALVAAQRPDLEQELEAAVLRNPGLLLRDGVLAWYVSRAGTRAEAAADALVACLDKGDTSNLRGIADVIAADPERVSMDREVLRIRLEKHAYGSGGGYGNRALEALAVLFPHHEAVKRAWHEFPSLIAGAERGSGQKHRPIPSPHPQTYLAVAYAAVDQAHVLHQLQRDLNWLDAHGQTLYDEALTRHVAYRLRRDATAADTIRTAIMDRKTSDALAAELVSLLAVAVSLDKDLLGELQRRLMAQTRLKLAPVVRDRVLSTSSSVKTVLTRVLDESR